MKGQNTGNQRSGFACNGKRFSQSLCRWFVPRIVWVGFIVGCSQQLQAETPDENAVQSPPTVVTSVSSLYPEVTCSSTDLRVNQVVLDMAAEARSEYQTIFNLGKDWRFPVHLRIVTNFDPLYRKVPRATFSVTTDGKTIRLSSLLPGSDPLLPEQVQRRFVMALLWEVEYRDRKTFDTTVRLDLAPTWLVEGLREKLNIDPLENREKIVWRSVKNERAPTLMDIFQWNPLSDAKLMGAWQRAFCYYLVKTLSSTPDRQDDFRLYVQSLSNPDPAKQFLPTESAWQRELLSSEKQQLTLIYTWEETDQQLRSQRIYVGDRHEHLQEFTLNDLANDRLAHTAQLTQEITYLYGTLLALQARGHPSWQNIIALYRQAVYDWLHRVPGEKISELLAQAQTLKTQERMEHQHLVDYMNWFEVTHNYGSPQFKQFFDAAQEDDHEEATVPNPLSKYLLDFEQRL